MKRYLALFLVASAVAVQAAGPFQPRYFKEQAVPESWVAADTPKGKLKLEAILEDQQPPLNLPDFIKQYGAPDRYLVPDEAHKTYNHLLVYDLLSGHSVVLHLGSPPKTRISAILVRDGEGKQLRLIK